jgi:Uma2 family endonuclease
MQRGIIAVYAEMPFVLTYNGDWVSSSRVPDIVIYNAERMSAYKAADPEWGKKPFVLVPDLCIEIISRNDKYTEVDDKVDRYLRDGVKVVWVINPRNTSVTVYSADGDSIVKLNKDKTLGGGDILPEFSLKVSERFETT